MQYKFVFTSQHNIQIQMIKFGYWQHLTKNYDSVM